MRCRSQGEDVTDLDVFRCVAQMFAYHTDPHNYPPSLKGSKRSPSLHPTFQAFMSLYLYSQLHYHLISRDYFHFPRLEERKKSVKQFQTGSHALIVYWGCIPWSCTTQPVDQIVLGVEWSYGFFLGPTTVGNKEVVSTFIDEGLSPHVFHRRMPLNI